MFSLILGGSRSGKSEAGLRLLEKEPGSLALVVTGKARDLEFNRQILEHKLARNPDIPVLEVDHGLGECLKNLGARVDAVLVDSIDFWVFNVFSREHPETYVHDFFNVLTMLQEKRLIFVSAEVGLGPVPASGYVRRFSRFLGQVNQRLAGICSEVTLVVAGLPVKIK
ncbi:bifunctional adenosylcobinamide kinase/adenosylcobinamide-phosphate guanylyltransferase [Desulfonatronovibrio hydrogenovorans]|uniref:bifunctional adenosylcobinamide kinase/adenosylcobinamide-phosphate guanylyltransferase n=1 Tax=Desulfonatronovibrio hydrogenovorans TaxID=53245 RepID=UPI00048FFAAD|nr:bifunctional adenosylcobinamide kinase/adenosylcobinamide-phosphate guanylyltransferase [Desulfonatronovibrio hydrogenovorans]